jgi:hypothetical protein
MEDLFKVLAAPIAFIILCYFIYQGVSSWISTNADAIGIAILCIVIGGGVIISLAMLRDNSVTSRMWQGMPENGPMKVNLEIEQRSPVRHRLHIDIKMTRKDWDALVATGFSNVTLFTYETPYVKDFPYSLGDNLRTKYVDFDDIAAAEAAKEEIIEKLHRLRNRIEAQHDFAARPADRKESLEI